MIDLHAIPAIGGLIPEACRPVLIAALTIVLGLLAAARIPKGALGRIEGRMRRLVAAGREGLHDGPAGRGDGTAAAPDPRPLPSDGLGIASGSDAKPLSGPETPPPPAPARAAGPARTCDEVHSADGEQILGRYCRMDTASTADGLEFTIEVPGLKETDLEISMVGDTIVVTGRRDMDRSDKTYRVVEREFGPFSRFIKVSDGVPLHRIQASLDRGLLTVLVPNPTIQAGNIAVNSAVRRVFDGDDVCELKIDLPGVDEFDIDLAVRDGVLTISCRNQAVDADEPSATPFGLRLLRSMELSAGVDADHIRAVLAKGVLTVTLPIAAGHRRRTIPLEFDREAAGSEMRTVDVDAAPGEPASGRRPSEAPFCGQGDPLFDFWSAGEILAGRSLHLGESLDRRF